MPLLLPVYRTSAVVLYKHVHEYLEIGKTHVIMKVSWEEYRYLHKFVLLVVSPSRVPLKFLASSIAVSFSCRCGIEGISSPFLVFFAIQVTAEKRLLQWVIHHFFSPEDSLFQTIGSHCPRTIMHWPIFAWGVTILWRNFSGFVESGGILFMIQIFPVRSTDWPTVTARFVDNTFLVTSNCCVSTSCCVLHYKHVNSSRVSPQPLLFFALHCWGLWFIPNLYSLLFPVEGVRQNA